VSEARDWDSTYQADDGPPPWDIGRPQPVIASLVEDGLLHGRVLDAGCGTGEHSLLLAEHGAKPYGVDLAPTAVQRAREKARERGVRAEFVTGSILRVTLPDGFDGAIDVGLFHSFGDEERPVYVDVLRRALRSGGVLALMCFSDRQPPGWGPRRVTEGELRDAFADGWTVERLEPAIFAINPLPHAESVDAWLAVLRRR
jgi:SAM-dependent methyltransferase